MLNLVVSQGMTSVDYGIHYNENFCKCPQLSRNVTEISRAKKEEMTQKYIGRKDKWCSR